MVLTEASESKETTPPPTTANHENENDDDRLGGIERSSDPPIRSPSSASDSLSILQRQLFLLVSIRCLRNAHLAPPPIVVPFYQTTCRLDSSQVVWLGSWYSALVALLEMPSGVLSDGLGRKQTLQLAFLGLGASWMVTYGSSCFVGGGGGGGGLSDHNGNGGQHFVLVGLGLAQLLRALGSSLYSGTDMAFLFELLKKHKQQQQQQQQSASKDAASLDIDDMVLKLESRQVVLSTLTEAFAAALGGLLGRLFGANTSIWISALPLLVGALICFGLEETATITNESDKGKKSKKNRDDRSDNGSDSNSNDRDSETRSESRFVNFTRRKSLQRLAQTLNRPSLRVVFGVGVLLNCGTYVAATALNPLLWQQVGLTNLGGGFLQASNSGVTALGALLAPTLKRYCSRSRGSGRDDGTRGLLLLLLATSALAYGFMAWNAMLSSPASVAAIGGLYYHSSSFQTISTIAAAWLLSLVRGLGWPVLGSALNTAIGEHNDGTRATVLSLFAGAIKLGMVVAGMVLGSMLRGVDDDNDHENNSSSPSLGKACTLCASLLMGTAVVVAVFTAPQPSTKYDRDKEVKKDE